MQTPVRPAERALARPRRRGLAAAAAILVLLAVAVAALANLRNPAPRDAAAPAAEFSAARAYAHVEIIGRETHVAGSPANDRVREYLVDNLRRAGLETEVQDTVAAEAGQETGEHGAAFARVRNVVARLPGTQPTGTVFLVAHYDSVQVGLGGNDDAAGTAALLEVASALSAGPRPRNDVVIVLTDAEEACLCGASGFAAGHPLAKGGGVVLNLEARGSTGPPIMFETSARNERLVRAYGRAAPHPIGTSFAVEIYRLLPNDTDFTAFVQRGFVGLNSAYIDGAAIYHTPLDTPARMDRSTLQAHGDNALALAREFGGTDVARLTAGGDATYFPVPGGLVRYPGWLTWPLAGLALLAAGALAVLARRRGVTSWPRLAAGFALALIPIVLAPIAAYLFWRAVTALRPGYAELLDPYRPLWYRLAVVALAATVLLTWYALTRRRTGPAALAIGGLGWLAALGLVLAAVTPGGSYLVTLPALAGALAGLVALATRPSGPWPVVVCVLAAMVGILVLVPTVALLFPALGMAMGGVAALLAVLLGLSALPVLDLLFPGAGGHRGMAALRARRMGAAPGLAAGLATVVLAGAGLAVDRFDAAHPAPTHLMYALDAGAGTARWISRESDPQPWTDQYVDDREPLADFPAIGDEEVSSGPAEAAPLPAPAVEVLADTRAGDERTLRVRVRPQRPGVRLVSLHVAASTATVSRATVAGRPVPIRAVAVDSGETGPAGGPPGLVGASDEGPWSWGMIFHAPPGDGVEVELVLRPRDGAVELRAMDASDDLSAVPGFRPRPPGVGVAGSHSSEMLAVARTYSL
ncbi:M28 family peptidase [Plantactinospora sp. GCM10030261]|uniref:M28 family peptidase n=1 Tax=Plantactinospora sp. GCM10030261 TaxID=3273420 RepID=UPI0036226781